MSEGLDQHDAFIALTGNDEENVIMSMFASGQGVRKVIPKVNRMTLGFILEKLGLESTITPKNIVADEIIQYVRAIQNTYGSNVESMIHLVDDRVEVLEFRAKSNCSFLNKPLCQLNLKEGIIVGYITHEGVSELANGNSIVREGDTVLIITRLNGLRELNDVLAN
jgi:trk system potassium uptake protein TrkA